ncbi:hypothetical protein FPK15_contig00006-0023 [Flavobacterium psychrophilum]|nr:hypothetical protein FPK15_contig00006-0023 [Flavobacterium psychrophilum]
MKFEEAFVTVYEAKFEASVVPKTCVPNVAEFKFSVTFPVANPFIVISPEALFVAEKLVAFHIELSINP